MYRGRAPPIFDVPEFPTLRRIKPLPKRRRTSGPGLEQVGSLTETPASLQCQNDTSASHSQQTLQTSTPPLVDPFIPSGITEGLLSRVDDLSTRMALQNYYIPILGNVQNFLASHGATAANGDGGSGSGTAAASAAAVALAAIAGAGRNGRLPIPSLADLDSIEFGVHFAAAAAAAAAAGLPMGGPSSLGMGSAGISMQMDPAGTSGDGKVNTIGAMSPLLVHDIAGLGPTGEYGSSLGGREEESSREDDYAHVRQPGNAKKRKVPANLSGSPRGLANEGEGGSPSSSYLDEDGSDSLPRADGAIRSTEVSLSKEQDSDRDRNDSTPLPVFPPPSFPGQLSMLIQKKGKLAAAALAGLQHKEQLKSRKRQLAAVMGALSHGDTLALDQALTFNYSFVAHSGEPLKIHRSKRRTVRLARAMNILMERPDRKNRHPDAVPFPKSDFTFKCPSLTADRLVATKEEVLTLRKRFEAELDRQAVKAAKPAVAPSDGGKPLAKSGRAKRERQERERDRVARAARQKKAKSTTTTREQSPELIDHHSVAPATGLGMGVGGKPKSGKKKKRSALANASNPHHLRNYVPSRLPHSGPIDGPLVNANNILPLPVRFLSAEIPAKGSSGNRKVVANTPLVQITQPAEEWICAFCEYDLFYGGETAYRKGVRNRKKVLRRRRRAAERAAAAASGGNTAVKTPPLPADDDYDEYSWSGTNENGNPPPQRNGRWKEAPDKEPTTHG